MAEALQISVILNAVDRMTAPMRAALGTNQALADSLAATRRRLAELDATGKNLSAYNKLKEQLAVLTPKMDAAKIKLSALTVKMQETQNPSEKLQQQFNRATAAVDKLAQSQTKLVSKLDAAENRLHAAGVSLHNLADAEQTLRAATAATTRSLEQQAGAVGRLLQRQEALARHQRAMATARNQMQNSLQLQQDVAGVAYPTLAAGTGLLYGATRPVMQAANLTDQVKDIAITGNIGNGDEAKLREQLRKVALDRNQLQETVGQGVQILVANGMDAKNAADYADMLGKAATASRAEMSDLSNVTFTLQNNMKIQGKAEMESAMNNLIHAGKQGQFELKEMARYFPSLAAQMASMGGTGQESVKELGIAMQAARKTAGTSGEAATNMQNWFSHMTAGSTVDHFKGVGIDLKQEMIKRMNDNDPEKRMGAFRASLDIFDKYIDKVTAGKTIDVRTPGGKLKRQLNFKEALADAKAGGNEAEVTRIIERFGLSEVIQDMQTANFYLAMRQNKDFIQKGMASFDSEEAKNTLNVDFAKRLESPIEQFKQAKIGFADALTQVGDAILPMITPLIQQVTQITQSVTAWAKANPTLVATLIKIAAVIGVAMVAFGGFAMTIISVLGPLAMFRYALGMLRLQMGFLLFRGGSMAGGAMGLLGRLKTYVPSLMSLASGARVAGQAILWLGRAAMLNPVGLTITAIAVAAYYLIGSWRPVKAFFSGLWTGLKQGFAPLASMFRSFWSSIKTGASALYSIVRAVISITAAVVQFIPGGALMVSGVKTVINWFRQWIPSLKLTDSSLNKVSASMQSWGQIAGQVISYILTMPARIIQAFAGLATKMLSIGADIMNGLRDGIISRAKSVMDSISGVVGDITGKAKSILGINSPSRVFMEIGGWTAEGLGKGLLRGQPQLMQHVTNLATALPQPVRDVVQQAANDPDLQPFNQAKTDRHSNVLTLPTKQPVIAQAPINQTITITITAAPGMDERAIADAVSRKLREHQREAQAKARGRMYD